MTSRNAWAYGRAAATRSCARFIFEVATISIVRVILRVFSTVLIRLLSSRPLAIGAGREVLEEWRHQLQVRFRDTRRLRHVRRLLVSLDAASQVGFDVLGQRLAGADAFTDLRVLRRHEQVE